MFKSIIDDIKYQFQSGNMLTRIILVNIAVFVFISIVFVFTSYGDVNGIYKKIIESLSLPSEYPKFLIYIWTWVTHMFLHERPMHLIFNMLILYWFGRIVGDFLGDKRILPLYLLGGLAGGIVYVISDYFFLFGSGGNATAMGASAAVMCMVMTAAMTSPDYVMHLLLIGPVRIKWIALVVFFFDILGTANIDNTGGHWAHLGGALFGIFYVSQLRSGNDLTERLQSLLDIFNPNAQKPMRPKRKKAEMQVVYNKGKAKDAPNEDQHSQGGNFQTKLDEILDKINESGYENLSDEEKEFLNQASKNS